MAKKTIGQMMMSGETKRAGEKTRTGKSTQPHYLQLESPLS
jgi:hypothetical protein